MFGRVLGRLTGQTARSGVGANDGFYGGAVREHQLHAQGVGGLLVGVPDQMEDTRLQIDEDGSAVPVDQLEVLVSDEAGRVALAPASKHRPPAVNGVGAALYRPL